MWQRLPAREKRRFLRHVRPYWDVHRHRLPSKRWRNSKRLHRIAEAPRPRRPALGFEAVGEQDSRELARAWQPTNSRRCSSTASSTAPAPTTTPRVARSAHALAVGAGPRGTRPARPRPAHRLPRRGDRRTGTAPRPTCSTSAPCCARTIGKQQPRRSCAATPSDWRITCQRPVGRHASGRNARRPPSHLGAAPLRRVNLVEHPALTEVRRAAPSASRRSPQSSPDSTSETARRTSRQPPDRAAGSNSSR